MGLIERIMEFLFCSLSNFLRTRFPASWLSEWIVQFCDNETLRSGFLKGTAMLLIIGLVTRALLSWKNQVLKLFKSSEKEGPSPIKVLWDSITAILMIIGVILLIAFLLTI